MLSIANMMDAHQLLQHVCRLSACLPLRLSLLSFDLTLCLNLLYFVCDVWIVDVGDEYMRDVLVI